LGIRPIIHLDKEGRLEIADKCRTRKKVLKRMLELAAEEAPLEAIFVAHAEAREDAEFLKQQMQELFPNLPIMLTGIGTVLAAHLGPGVIGLFVRRKP
jgi:fatty acid-binding protein DegV